MLFWRKKNKYFDDGITIQCPVCEWQPHKKDHWRCTCGKSWNTFDTKGKCPKCKRVWEETRCMGCGSISAHKDWYKTKEDLEEIEIQGNTYLRVKKKSLESRLIEYGIRNYRIKYLEDLDYSKEEFQLPYDAACRMIIFYAIFCITDGVDKIIVVSWLKNENIWQKVSPEEKTFFTSSYDEKELLMDLSWRIEAALTLGWTLNIVEELPKLDSKNNHKTLEKFVDILPKVGEPLNNFLSGLKYRDIDEIYEEALLNEKATAYFRDLLFSTEKNETKINRFVSFERHKVLNWWRKCFGISQWDETDTST
ncbi:DUF4272 domain-containing protein [Bernardetia sp.]|uniref:DUF4272 domain-containing protein n=1 Tax=Bernardetia sp. TaxID=1937974 RepID=UPI0025BF5BF5|nr:DUF4272 domain-containing protein [Bernardetia sp.]